MNFTDMHRERYSRQIMLDEMGEDGQKKLLDSKVLIIGAGGLGSPAALYLAAAGVGQLTIADGDEVSLSNLQRQIIHTDNDIGRPKVLSAQEKLMRISPYVKVRTVHEFVTDDNIADIIADHDIVIDATDNFAAKFMINDACVRAEKPFVHGGMLGFGGQIMTYVPHVSPCYRCVFGDIPEETGGTVGIIGAMPGVIGSLQALEAVKFIIGSGELYTGRLLVFDGLSGNFRTVKLPAADEKCPACGGK